MLDERVEKYRKEALEALQKYAQAKVQSEMLTTEVRRLTSLLRECRTALAITRCSCGKRKCERCLMIAKLIEVDI